MADVRFRLKTAPPRLGRTAPARKRLERRWAEINDRTAIVVTAPQGFGKTTLLAQWRRNWLERGAFVAWATLDAQDDRARFVDLLLFSLRAATGRESFALAATQNMLQANRELQG
jgi:LuxR family maltose regulon positive regulatory protein